MADTTSQGGGISYEVVNYSDVRGVAEDAAATALERQGAIDAQVLADSVDSASAAAAGEAVSGVTEHIDARIDELVKSDDEELGKIADDAASKALDGVQQTLDEQLEQLSETQAQETVQTVQLCEDQRYAVEEYARMIYWQTALNGILIAALIGIMVWLTIVRNR